jgi:hypothetical protein
MRDPHVELHYTLSSGKDISGPPNLTFADLAGENRFP